MTTKNIAPLLLFILLPFGNCLAQQDADITHIIDQQTLSWAKAESSKDVQLLSDLYGDSVFFYGKKLGKIACLKLKQSVMNKYPDYKDEIYGKIDVTLLPGGIAKASFVKKITYNAEVKYFSSYLSYCYLRQKWLIIEESDKTTDANLLKMKNHKKGTSKYLLTGDFNGDGKLDSATVIYPTLSDDGMDCKGKCETRVRFSDRTIPDIVVDDCIGGNPVNHGDLNENGTDEIGLQPQWFTSCWSAYYVYTLINNKWEYAVKPFSTHCDQWEQGVIPIEKDKNKKGNAIIRYSQWDEKMEYIMVVSKSVPVRK